MPLAQSQKWYMDEGFVAAVLVKVSEILQLKGPPRLQPQPRQVRVVMAELLCSSAPTRCRGHAPKGPAEADPGAAIRPPNGLPPGAGGSGGRPGRD